MRKEKALLLNEIKDKISGASAMLVASYDKLEPNTSWQLRELLSKQGSTLEVVRKRVFLKALEQSGVQMDTSNMKGHIGVVFIGQTDAMAPAKTVFKFSEENANLLTVLCGQLDGKMVPGPEIKTLSELPSLDEMRAILLGLFTSPMAQTLSVMEAYVASKGSAE